MSIYYKTRNNTPIGQGIIVTDANGTTYTAEEFVDAFQEAIEKTVYYVVKRREFSSFSIEDVVQDAMMRCLQNAHRYDPSFNTTLRYYVQQSTIGHAKRYLRDNSHIIRAPRTIRECASKINSMYDIRDRSDFKDIAKLAKETGYDEKDIRDTLEYLIIGRNPISTETTVSDDGNTFIKDLIAAPNEEDEYYYLKNLVIQYMEHDATEQERILISGKFTGVSQTDIGQAIGVSQMQVSRLQRRAINRMSKILQERRKQYE